jgi:hypothetical protein
MALLIIIEKGKQLPEGYEATLFNTKKEFEGA